MKKNILILFIILIFYSCSETNNNNKVLASFQGGNVQQSEYIEHYLLSTKYKPNKLPTEENLKKIVLKKALEKIAVIEAQEQKIELDSLYQHIIESNERRLLSQKFVQSKIISSVITDSLIHKFYNEFSPQYRMKYIMRPFLKESSTTFINSQKKQIEEAYKMLKKDENFEKVVEKYSQDVTTNKKGGDLGWMIRESMGDEALRAVFDTLSQFTYSKPFKGYGGYYILYKGEKREVNVPAMKSVKQKIWKTLYHSRLAFVKNAIDEEFEQLSQKYNYTVYTDVINNLFEKFSNSKSNSKSVGLNFNNFSDKDQNTVIARYNDNSIIMVKDLFTDRKRSPTNKYEFIKRLRNIAQQHLFSKYAKEINLQNEPELKEQLNQMRTSLLRTILYQKMVKDKVQNLLDSEELKGVDKVKKRAEFEKKLRTEFENKLKTKYKFKFETQNFKSALTMALQKKKLQNAENKK